MKYVLSSPIPPALLAGAAFLIAFPVAAAAPPHVIDREGLPGAAIYQAHCAQCHNQAVYKAPAKSFLQALAPEAIYAAMTAGLMQVQGAALADAEKHAVADYLGDADLAQTSQIAVAPSCPGPVQLDSAAPRLTSWGAEPTNNHAISRDVARLSATDIPRLKLKWALAFPGTTRVRSQPTVAQGMLFVGSQSGVVYALDAHSGCLHWRFQASAEVRTPVVLSNETGQAPQRMLAFFGDVVGHVYALDATTGTLKWKLRVDDHGSATLTAAPAYHAGRLYVPVSSLEEATAAAGYECCTFRGAVVALEAESGRVIWRRHTIDQDARVVAKTSKGTNVWGPSGAAVWNSPTIDERRGVLYVGTGDNYSEPATERSDAVIAMDLATGSIRWVHQVRKGDVWNVACMLGNENCAKRPGPDFDIGAGTMLMHGTGQHDLVIAGMKSGHVIAIDPDHPSHAAWFKRFARGGIQGGIQYGMAVDQDGIYVPVADMSDNHDGKVATQAPRPGLYAVDPTTGKSLWSAPADNVCHGRVDCDPGILASINVIPGAVFAGHMDGRVRAYDSRSGHVMWEYDTTQEVTALSGIKAHGGTIGAAGPVVVDGIVYVESGYGLYWHMPGNVLLAFSVDGV